MTTVLGINAYHGDASAALIVDGTLVAAVEEERFNRIKHWAGFPAQSIRWCLEHAGVQPDQINHVAISFQPRANLLKKVGFTLRNQTSPKAVLQRLKRQGKTLSIEDHLAKALGVKRTDITATLHRVEHHHAHVGAGFLISPFEDAAVLSVDGMGDFVSTLTAYGRGNRWTEFERVYYPHSLGYLYNAITMYLGFPNFGDEYKVMGLAPYGEPEYIDFFRRLIYPKGDTFELNLDYFTHHKSGIAMSWDTGTPVVEPFFSPRLIRELGPMREKGVPVEKKHENIARSLQVVSEEIIFHLLRRLHRRTACRRLCLTGGVAMNSVANGKITRETPFREVYIPAGAADNGTSFGAAFYVWNTILENKRTFVQNHAYWGCESTNDEILTAIQAAGLSHEFLDDEADLLDRVVTRIISGEVIGWFQGRMEFGARALGNRSIIADPRRTDMRDIINLRIKFREKFRPFAPSILEEDVADWFEISDPTPYMEKVFPIKPERHAAIPAVTHVDGSGRLQTVSKATNPRYHALITRFKERTGVPILLNTSLNENEPVVRTAAEAIACFQRTSMNALVLGNYLIARE